MQDVDELEDWDWKDFNVSRNESQFGETFREKSIVDDTIFNDVTVQPEDKVANRNSRLKVWKHKKCFKCKMNVFLGFRLIAVVRYQQLSVPRDGTSRR